MISIIVNLVCRRIRNYRHLCTLIICAPPALNWLCDFMQRFCSLVDHHFCQSRGFHYFISCERRRILNTDDRCPAFTCYYCLRKKEQTYSSCYFGLRVLRLFVYNNQPQINGINFYLSPMRSPVPLP